MRTRSTAITVTAALALVGCSSDSKDDKAATSSPSSAPSIDISAAGIPPKPNGAKRIELLRALSAANPGIVKYEDKAIDAARNQCSAINGGSAKADWAASQRFSYKDVTTTEAQGKQINEALKSLGFCKV